MKSDLEEYGGLWVCLCDDEVIARRSELVFELAEDGQEIELCDSLRL